MIYMEVYCSTNMYSNYWFSPCRPFLYLVIAPMNISSSDWGAPYEIQFYLSVQSSLCRNIHVHAFFNIDLIHHYVQFSNEFNSSAFYAATTNPTRLPPTRRSRPALTLGVFLISSKHWSTTSCATKMGDVNHPKHLESVKRNWLVLNPHLVAHLLVI